METSKKNSEKGNSKILFFRFYFILDYIEQSVHSMNPTVNINKRRWSNNIFEESYWENYPWTGFGLSIL